MPDLPLQTDRLELRPFQVGDIDAFLAYRSRQDVARYLLQPPLDRGAAAARIQQIMNVRMERDNDRFDLAIVRRNDGELLGDVGLFLRSVEHGMAELGFSLHPDHQGQGFAREASERMMQVAFEDLGLHRVIGRCDVRNDASSGLLRRLGLRQEAHFVRNEMIKGEWTDELVFAVLAEEWAARS